MTLTSPRLDTRSGAGTATVLPATTYSADQALGYVNDTYSLRNPVERALAEEVTALRAALDAENGAHVHLLMQAAAVCDVWRRLDPHSDAGGRIRAQLRKVAPYDLIGELDELAERA